LDRLFLDANVLFSAAYRSTSGLRKFWTLADVELVTSTYTVEEARRNLSEESQRRTLGVLLEGLEVIDQPPFKEELRTSGLPEKDLPVLAAAFGVGATHLVTGDRRHFGKFFGRDLHGVRVLSPADYLTMAG
jgi:uncharacterized protein